MKCFRRPRLLLPLLQSSPVKCLAPFFLKSAATGRILFIASASRLVGSVAGGIFITSKVSLGPSTPGSGIPVIHIWMFALVESYHVVEVSGKYPKYQLLWVKKLCYLWGEGEDRGGGGRRGEGRGAH